MAEDPYGAALARAANALARDAAKTKELKTKNSPWQAAKVVGDVVDIPLSLAGLPPVAGAIGETVTNLGTGQVPSAGKSALDATQKFVSWREQKDKKKTDDTKIDEFIKMFLE